MSVQDYKQSIKEIIDATDNELLLKHWKEQLEYDVKHTSEIEISEEEWNLVQEGITDYDNGQIISLEDFISKRK